ncbi:MAG: hypothetical protein IT332_01345 [Ardenticatenales bacterium]|nr:hypothetical protein [Ardenticatenales bacterium]
MSIPANDVPVPSSVGRWTRTDTALALALTAAAFAYFWPLFAPAPHRRWFVDGDFVDQFLAFARFEASALADGRLPLWNPYAFGGGPFWADIQAAVAYPPSLAVVGASLALTGGVGVGALQIEAVAHIALAAVFTYAFARRVLGARAGAVLAAVAFAFGGYLTGYPPLQLAVLESNAWLPLALLAVDRVVSGGDGNGRFDITTDVVLLAVALAMAILAGHPQSALYLVYTCLAWTLWRARPWRRTPRRIWTSLVTAAVAALGLSAAGWLPAAHFLGLSNRAEAGYEMLGHGFPPRELLGLVVPGLTHWSPLYVGVLPLSLAVWAGWAWLAGGEGYRPSDGDDRGAGNPTTFFLALAALALALSLGARAIAFDAAYHLAPGFALFRGQERAAFLVSFALAMLAGTGFAQASSSTRWKARRRGIGRWLAPTLIALAWLELYRVGARVNLAAAPPSELTTTPLIALLRNSAGLGRVHDDDRLPRNFGVLHGIESTNGASPLVLRHYLRLREGLLPAHEARFWQLTATSAVISWRDRIDGAEPILGVGEGDLRTTVHGLANPSPYAWRAFRAVPVATDDDALVQLRDAAFDPFGTVLLHDGAQGGGPYGTDGATGVDGRGPAGDVAVRTDGGTPGWIVFSEVWHPGWRATIDGRPAPVLRADVALIAVAVPPGEHAVSLRFADRWAVAGIAVSTLAATILGLAVAWAGVRRRGERRLRRRRDA